MRPSLVRRLALMRHAKSSWKDPFLLDHARPLSGRGRRDAPRMGAWLVGHGWVPEVVALSDSERTQATWRGMAPLVGATLVPRVRRSLYHSGLEAIRAKARSWSPGVRTVLAIGHNPGWEDALAWLTGQDPGMTTGNIALLEGEGPTWTDALQGRWTLVALGRPRELPD